MPLVLFFCFMYVFIASSISNIEVLFCGIMIVLIFGMLALIFYNVWAFLGLVALIAFLIYLNGKRIEREEKLHHEEFLKGNAPEKVYIPTPSPNKRNFKIHICEGYCANSMKDLSDQPRPLFKPWYSIVEIDEKDKQHNFHYNKYDTIIGNFFENKEDITPDVINNILWRCTHKYYEAANNADGSVYIPVRDSSVRYKKLLPNCGSHYWYYNGRMMRQQEWHGYVSDYVNFHINNCFKSKDDITEEDKKRIGNQLSGGYYAIHYVDEPVDINCPYDEPYKPTFNGNPW